MATGPYRMENVSVNAMSVATNNPYTSAFRGFGAPQVCVAYEQQMDEIAKACGMDPYELRRINYLHKGDRTAHGQELITAVWLEETTTRVLEALGEKTPDHGAVKVGQGFASYYAELRAHHLAARYLAGLGRAGMDGTATIRAGVPDLGAGQISAPGPDRRARCWACR